MKNLRILLFLFGLLSLSQVQAQSSGGLFLSPGAEAHGRPFVFSNRGEVEAILAFQKAYVARDVAGMRKYFVPNPTLTNDKNEKIKFSEEVWNSAFADAVSIAWDIAAIVPIRIKDTDPSSGAMVYSQETIKYKDGRVEKKQLLETFYFNNDMKISAVDAFSKPLP